MKPAAMPMLMNDNSLRAALEATGSKPCACSVGVCASWESLPEERWPKSQIVQIGTLRNPDLAEPTFKEHHVQANGKMTYYDSPDAPISALHFPYNRCDVHQCRQCHRVLLKYTEFGGYFVDQRVRWAKAPPNTAE